MCLYPPFVSHIVSLLMKDNTNTTGATKSPKPNGNNLSLDGKWRSFRKVPNLLQYVSTGLYFARIKVDGKLIRRGLDTNVRTTALLKLADFKVKHSEPKPEFGTFGAALKKYLRAVNTTHELKPESKRYRRFCIKALLKSWPRLRVTPVLKITVKDCQEWAGRFAAAKDEQYYNNTLAVLRSVLAKAGIPANENPARKGKDLEGVNRLGVKSKDLQLPEAEQFDAMVHAIETSGAGRQQECADLVRFLAFSGCRISEARKVTWADVDLERGEIKVFNAKRAKKSDKPENRQVPIIPPMRELLQRLSMGKHNPADRVCELGECEKSLVRACRIVSIPKITHHDLRHLFATRAIQSGVDVPTVAEWLGHSDGGALAMKTYRHASREHSQNKAKLVTFGSPAAPANVIPMKAGAV